MGTPSIYEKKIHDNTPIEGLKYAQINEDAVQQDHAVRKSQAEQIASEAAQGVIKDSLASPDQTSTASTQLLVEQLATKQVNMSVAASSTLFLAIDENGVLSFSNLGRGKIHKDTTSVDFASFLATVTFLTGDDAGIIEIGGEKYDAGTEIFLTASQNAKQTSYIYTGGLVASAESFINTSDKYDAAEVRALLSAAGIGLNYDSNTGVYSLKCGTGPDELGGQNIPHGATFNVISPAGDIADVLKKLEDLIASVEASGADGTAILTTRLNNLSGVPGSNMGIFTGNLFAANQNIKQLLQATENKFSAVDQEFIAVRAEASNRANAVDQTINQLTNTVANNKQASDDALAVINGTGAGSIAKAASDERTYTNQTKQTLETADSELSGRLDTLEGSGVGSVAKAQSDAQAYTDTRESAIMDHVNDNAADIAKLTSNNLEFVGSVDVNGKFIASETDARDGFDFNNIALKAGETFVFNAAVNIAFANNSHDFVVGDTLTARTDVNAGAAKFDDSASSSQTTMDFIYQPTNSAGLDKGNLGSSTIDLDTAEHLRVTPDSIGRDKLDANVEADIDDKVSLTADAQTITGKALKIEQSDDELGSSYGLYIKKTQTGSDALTGTARALLVENIVKSNGSGNPALPCYAHNTITSHAEGECADMSLVVAGAYCEANTKATNAINAIGSYSVATDTQLGVNIGAFAAAENGAVSNVSMLAYASTDGVGADRGVVGAITSQSLALYSATRVADPFPYNDIAIAADAKYAPAGSKAFYSYGDVVMEGGTVSVPRATTDASAVNLGDIKALEEIHEFDLSSGSKVITTALDLAKVKPAEFTFGVTGVEIDYAYDVASSQVTVTATGDSVASLTSVKMFLKQYACDITSH